MFRRMMVGLAIWLMPLPAMAQENECGYNARQIVEALYPEARQISDVKYAVDSHEITVPLDEYLRMDPHVMVCRVWPAYPDRLLIAVPVMGTAPAAEIGFDAEGDLDLFVVNPETLAIEAQLRLKNFIQEDAIHLGAIWFDTAPYRLLGDRIAFGLRREMNGSSRANPYDMTGLWLFDVDGGQIRPILEGLQVGLHQGEWDMECAGEFHESSWVLEISDQRHHGAADLIAKPTAMRRQNRMEGGKCMSFDMPPERPVGDVTLRYDGTGYQVPEEMRGR